MKEELVIFNILKKLGCCGILITDGDGKVVCMDEPFFEEEWGLLPHEILGRSAFDLERTGVIKPALALKVMETRKEARQISAVKGLYNVVGEAFPIFEEKDKIKWIVTFTRDVISEKEVLRLYDEILERFIKGDEKDCNALSKWITEEGLTTFNAHYATVLAGIKKIATYDVTVLLTGDTGTGKSMMAKKIHNLSGVKGDFVELNCGSVSQTLMESELYGYEKGSFTGAEKTGKKGLVECAENGTLFLDEISEMPLNLQVKLLHFLQEKKIRRVGGTKNINVNCRVIAATNKNLENEVKEGRFREDLFYRLNLASFNIPSLRERYEDIVPLAKSILDYLNTKYQKQFVFDYDVLSCFEKYPWKGNVRELENTIHRMILMAEENVLRKDLLPKSFTSSTSNFEMDFMDNTSEEMAVPEKSYRQQMEEAESKIILQAFRKYGSSSKVGEALGIGQTTAARKIRKYVGHE